jgi:phage/plasmid-associated DNA primase
MIDDNVQQPEAPTVTIEPEPEEPEDEFERADEEHRRAVNAMLHPTEILGWQVEYLNGEINSMFSDSNFDLAVKAKSMLETLGVQYIVVSTGVKKENKTIYIRREGKYIRADASGLELYIIQVFVALRQQIESRIENITNQIEREHTDKEARKLIKEDTFLVGLRKKKMWCETALNETARRHIEGTLCTMAMIDEKEAGLDTDLTKKPLLNGVYDLIKHKIVPYGSEHRYTRVMSINYDNKALCPMFEAHIKYVLPDEATREFFLETVASALLMSRRQELIFILQGFTAENGKSELMRMITTAFGEYGTFMDSYALTETRAKNATQPELAKAIGAALVVIDEPAKDMMSSSIWKNIANYATIVFRDLYESSKSSRWTATPYILTNKSLQIDTKDAGNARRPCVIPFKQQITQAMKDADVRTAEYLTMRYGEYVGKVEAAGIFNYLMIRLKRFQERGYKLPEFPSEVKDATQGLIFKHNDVARFVFEKCTTDAIKVDGVPMKPWVIKKDFNKAFVNYCIDELEYTEKYIMKPDSIQEVMESLGFPYKMLNEKRTGNHTVRVYDGIRLKASPKEITTLNAGDGKALNRDIVDYVHDHSRGLNEDHGVPVIDVVAVLHENYNYESDAILARIKALHDIGELKVEDGKIRLI